MTHRDRAMLVLGLATVIANSASAQDLSSRQRRALSAREADRVARRDLLSILEPTGKNQRGMLRRMRGTSFFTHPYTTPFRGLCRKDMLSLHYGATVSDSRYEDAPLRPFAVETRALYRVTSRKFSVTPRDEKFGREPFDGDCSSQSEDDWFFADNDALAATGYAAARAAADRLSDGMLEVTCDATSACIGLAKEILEPDGIGNIEVCPAPANERCFEIGGASTVTIHVSGNADVPIGPSTIKSIEVVERIVVT